MPQEPKPEQNRHPDFTRHPYAHKRTRLRGRTGRAFSVSDLSRPGAFVPHVPVVTRDATLHASRGEYSRVPRFPWVKTRGNTSRGFVSKWLGV